MSRQPLGIVPSHIRRNVFVPPPPTPQAGSMLRGSLLAALAGTATVCASLAYLKPGEGGRERTASSSASSDSDAQVEAEEEEPGADVVDPSPTQGPRRERGQDTLSRIRGYRDGLQRWMTAVSPTTRNMVRDNCIIAHVLPVNDAVMGYRAFVCNRGAYDDVVMSKRQNYRNPHEINKTWAAFFLAHMHMHSFGSEMTYFGQG